MKIISKLGILLSSIYAKAKDTAFCTWLQKVNTTLKTSLNKYLLKYYLSNLYTSVYDITLKTWSELTYDKKYELLIKKGRVPLKYRVEAYKLIYDEYISLSDNKELKVMKDQASKIQRLEIAIFQLHCCLLVLTIHDAEGCRKVAAKYGYSNSKREVLCKKLEVGLKMKTTELNNLKSELAEDKKETEIKGKESVYDNLASLQLAGFDVSIDMPLAQYIRTVNTSVKQLKSMKHGK
jgi:hypothetical protein